MTISLVFILIVVAGIIFLTLLGKNGWTPAMRALLVLAVVPLALLFVSRANMDRSRSATPATTTAFVVEQQGNRRGFITVEQNGVVDFVAPGGRVNNQPIRGQLLVSDSAGGVLRTQAQVRTVARGRWSVLFVLIFVGAVGFGVVYQVRRGAWKWPAVLKVCGLALGAGFLILMGVKSMRQERSRSRANYEARTISITSDWPLVEAPRMRPVGSPEVSPEARRYRDVEVWRRESILGFVPFSQEEIPDWCREGLETESESVVLHDTEFLSSLPEGRDWIAGYSSQDPEIQVAQRDALAAARRKLALEALLQVKKAVPDFAALPFEKIAERLVMRHSIGDRQDTYLEKVTLEHERRPYGSVYRAAVRIRADPETIDTLARRICRSVDFSGEGRDPDVQGAFFSAMILVALAFSAFLVYVFLRAGVTGRWVVPLRVVSGGMLLAVVAAAVYVSVNLGAS